MAIYEVLVRQTYFGKNPINRFHFVSSGVPAATSGSLALLVALGMIPDNGVYPAGSVFRTWLSLVSNQLSFREVQAKNLYDVEDFYVTPFADAHVGEQPSEAMTPINALGLHSSRVRTDIQSGSKRLCGVTEAQVGEGGVLVGGTLDTLNSMGAKLTATLSYDDEGTPVDFRTAILHFRSVPVIGKPDKLVQYATEAEQLAQAAIGVIWSAMPTVRSQVSRQYR